MTLFQQIFTIAVCVLGTMTTRFLPFLVFSEKHDTPAYVKYLGKVLPAAVFGMLVVYSLKDVTITSGSHGLPELIGICVTVALQLWKKKMLLSIAGGTVVTMILVQFVFI